MNLTVLFLTLVSCGAPKDTVPCTATTLADGSCEDQDQLDAFAAGKDAATADFEARLSALEGAGFVTATAVTAAVDAALTAANVATQGDLSAYALTTYVDSGDVEVQTWVTAQNYLTSSDLTDYATMTVTDALATDISSISADYLTSADMTEVDELFSYLTVDSATNTVTFSGANLHVNNGLGSTDGVPNDGITNSDPGVVNNLGNLIVGYDEGTVAYKTGSHNLVVGSGHSYYSYGSLIAGYGNGSDGPYNLLAGGSNTAQSEGDTVIGGAYNLANGGYSSILGGAFNGTSGYESVVVGGNGNTTNGELNSILGGGSNITDGFAASIHGGHDVLISSDYGYGP